jgi:hypothetical protein
MLLNRAIPFDLTNPFCTGSPLLETTMFKKKMLLSNSTRKVHRKSTLLKLEGGNSKSSRFQDNFADCRTFCLSNASERTENLPLKAVPLIEIRLFSPCYDSRSLMHTPQQNQTTNSADRSPLPDTNPKLCCSIRRFT